MTLVAGRIAAFAPPIRRQGVTPGSYQQRHGRGANPSRALMALTSRRRAHRPRTKPCQLAGWGRRLLPGGKPQLHSADMAPRPTKSTTFGAHSQRAARGP
jgi:hypothetical protein